MRLRPGGAAALWLALLPAAAGAQFIQYSPAGDFVSPSESREETFDAAMEEARWRFGRLLVDPWFGVRNVGYQDNVTSGTTGDDASDFTASLGAGVNTYLPLGSDFIWGTFVLPEYTWWKDESDRRRLNGRYGTGLFGNLGRIGVEGLASRFEEPQIFSREFEEQVNQRTDEGLLTFTLDIGKGFLLFARGTLRRYRSLDDEGVLAVLRGLDREERIVGAGVGVRLKRGWSVGIGLEESEAEFEPGSIDRSNSGSSVVLEYEYDGPYFDLTGDLALRSIEPEPGSAFVEFDGLTGRFNLAGRPLGPVQLQLFGGRDVTYALQADSSYFEEDRLGVALVYSVGSLASLRAFAESGESAFVAVAPAGPQRVDDRASYGLSVSVRRGPVSIGIGAERNEYESNFPQFDREFTRITSSVNVGLGRGRASPWANAGAWR